MLPGTGKCFRCHQAGHWTEKCWTLTPPESRDHHDARIATYRLWFTDQERITAYEKQKLIEQENRMWNQQKGKAA